MENSNSPNIWVQNNLTQLQMLHFQATRLKKAIHSQEEHGLGQKDLEFEFYDWFNPFDELFCALLDGAIPDLLAGHQDAIALFSSAVADLPGNQEIYRRLLGQFMKVLSSPI